MLLRLKKTLLLTALLAGPAMAVMAGPTSDLQVVVHGNGSVDIFDNHKFVGNISPIVFTQGWTAHGFEGVGPYPAARWSAEVSEGCDVSIQSTVEVQKSGLHFHYILRPTKDVSVIAVRAILACPYGDWMGAPFNVGGHGGTLPDKTTDTTLGQTFALPVSMGPSPAHGGLTLSLTPAKLHALLQDARPFGGSIATILDHGEKYDAPWIWAAGVKKTFDFSVAVNRPTRQVFVQGPQRPFPYLEENLALYNAAAGVTLSATLTLPKGTGPFPALELLAGGVAYKRDGYDQELLILADELSRCGIATLRYDKRGIGESTGDYSNATTKDFADDAACGVAFLKTRTDINQDKVGLLGHSEGGLVASMVAASAKGIALMVLLAAPGTRFPLRTDPSSTLSQLRCPVLAVAGSLDQNVPPDANLAAITEALPAASLTTRVFPNLNHSFRRCVPGNPYEVVDPLEIIDPQVLAYVGDWVAKQVN